MTVAGPQRHAVDLSQFRNLGQSFFGKGRLALKGVQDDSLEQVAERQVFELRQRLQYFQQTLFYSNARLHAFNFAHGCLSSGTYVPRYTISTDAASRTSPTMRRANRHA